jgi:hypothetical protein
VPLLHRASALHTPRAAMVKVPRLNPVVEMVLKNRQVHVMKAKKVHRVASIQDADLFQLFERDLELLYHKVVYILPKTLDALIAC